MRLNRLCTAMLAVALAGSAAKADLIQEFALDTGSGSVAGAVFTNTLTGLVADGVIFDATITVTGFESPADGGGTKGLTQTSNGLGVDDSGLDSSDLVSDGEALRFTMSISNEVGGTVAFNGFTEIDYNNFGGTDSGGLSLDNLEATAGDNFFTTTNGVSGQGIVDISGTSPSAFSAFASSGGTNSFRVDDVTGSFTGTIGSVTAIPEPGSMALMLVGAVGVAGYQVRRRRNKSAE